MSSATRSDRLASLRDGCEQLEREYLCLTKTIPPFMDRQHIQEAHEEEAFDNFGNKDPMCLNTQALRSHYECLANYLDRLFDAMLEATYLSGYARALGSDETADRLCDMREELHTLYVSVNTDMVSTSGLLSTTALSVLVEPSGGECETVLELHTTDEHGASEETAALEMEISQRLDALASQFHSFLSAPISSGYLRSFAESELARIDTQKALFCGARLQ